MHDLDKLKRHAALFDEMAQLQGVDLEQAMLDGQLSIPDLDDAVLRCANCKEPRACAVWQAQQSVPVIQPPAYCQNQELFTELKEG